MPANAKARASKVQFVWLCTIAVSDTAWEAYFFRSKLNRPFLLGTTSIIYRVSLETMRSIFTTHCCCSILYSYSSSGYIFLTAKPRLQCWKLLSGWQSMANPTHFWENECYFWISWPTPPNMIRGISFSFIYANFNMYPVGNTDLSYYYIQPFLLFLPWWHIIARIPLPPTLLLSPAPNY